MKRRSIVAIHGVGVPPLGSVLERVHSTMGHDTGPGYRSDIVIDGHIYPRLKFQQGPVKELVEVNWADVQRASKTSVGFLRHLIYILTSLLTLGSLEIGAHRKPIRFANWYRIAFESVLIWCIYPPVLIMLLSISGELLIQVLLSLLVLGFVCLLALYLCRFGRWYYAGFAWLVLLFALDILAITGAINIAKLTAFATSILSYGQLFVVVLLLVASAEVFVKYRNRYSREQKLTRLVFLYTPFVVMSAVGALIWASVLLAAKIIGNGTSGNYEDWQSSYLAALNYDLEKMEYVFGGAIFLIGVLVAIGFVKYWLRTKFRNAGQPPGLGARNWLSLLAEIVPIVLVSVGVIYFYYAILGPIPNNQNKDILAIYTWSAMRAIPFIPFLVGPLAIVLDVLGDVVFYLLPDDAHQSTVEATRSRLKALLLALKSDSVDADTIVLSHSQGSVVALDVLGANPNLSVKLITAGSPIASLYERFLHCSAADRISSYQQPKTWSNFYTIDDYIGGQVRCSGVNEEMVGYGGHTNYWSNKDVANAALKI